MQNRRTLHEPFFPQPSNTTTTTPSTPPLSSSSSSQPPTPSFPKYPFSSNPQQPFFPDFPSPSPPPPSTSSVPTFPANLSTLIYPNNPSDASPHHSHTTPRLLPAILLSLIALSLLSLSAAFLFHRRRRHHRGHSSPKRSNKPAAASSAAAAAPAPPAPPPPHPLATATAIATPDFLYLGTFVSNRSVREQIEDKKVIGSPELRPLPPLSLSREFKLSNNNNYQNATAGTDSDDEFYSPKGGSATNGSTRSSSRRNFEAVAVKCGSDLSTTSYPDSNSGTSDPPSPVGSSPRSKNPRSETPPPPPPPLPFMRPLTPSPPKKRKPPSPSPPSSPPVERRSARKFEFLGQNSRNQAAMPPPPPPPPPPVGYWESQVRKPPMKTPVALKRPIVDVSESSNSVARSSYNNEETMPRAKLKPLHWDKVRASSDRVMVWDQIKSSSFQVNEEMIETLFGCNTGNAAATGSKETSRQHPAGPSPRMQENRVLDPKKSQNIAILLRALNVTKEEVCEALLEGNTESLGTELLETLLKMAPTKEEELKLKEHREDSPFKLGPAEKFLKAVLDIPFAFKRVEAMLYIANFDSEVSYLKDSFNTLEAACEELRNSRLFLKLLEAVLKTGNRMNVGTNRGDAHAFKLDTLLKLVDVKGTDGKTTLLHFVVQEIIRTEGSRLSSAKTQANTLQNDLECKKLGLKVVSALGGELANVKRAAAMDSEVLSSYVSKLAGGIGKIADVLRLNEASSSRNSSKQFQESINGFLKKAENDIIKVQAQESVALSLVKEITEYFHGNSAKEEAHPFRIFMVVRDFLSILDQVCKEVGKINERTIASSVRQFPVPVNPTLPPLFPKIRAMRPESSDDESSSSSS